MLFGGILKKLLFAFLGNDGNPFSIMGFMHPTDADGKYVIEAEGIRLAFVKKGGALANLWINNTNCQEIDIVMGFDNATQYQSYKGSPTLNGAIGKSRIRCHILKRRKTDSFFDRPLRWYNWQWNLRDGWNNL